MHIKIYFGDKPLFLCDKIDPVVEPYVHHDDAIYMDELDSHTIKTIIHEMQQPQIHAGVFMHQDLEQLKCALFKKFTIIHAAGGAVENEKGELLLIFRKGKWDLPKGKLDEGESLEECAVREVEEETAVTGIELVSPLAITYHTYHEGTKFILKESHWYNMRVAGKQQLVPQTEEGIDETRWVAPADIGGYVGNCYPSIRDVLKARLAE